MGGGFLVCCFFLGRGGGVNGGKIMTGVDLRPTAQPMIAYTNGL